MFIGSESEGDTHTGDWKQERRERYLIILLLFGWLVGCNVLIIVCLEDDDKPLDKVYYSTR